jgi:hypothetical protein
MCNQAVGLIQGCIESEGIPTVSIALLKEVVEKVRPPRSLWVPFPMGYPVGEPGRPETQRRVLLQALELLSLHSPSPILEDYFAAGQEGGPH